MVKKKLFEKTHKSKEKNIGNRKKQGGKNEEEISAERDYRSFNNISY